MTTPRESDEETAGPSGGGYDEDDDDEASSSRMMMITDDDDWLQVGLQASRCVSSSAITELSVGLEISHLQSQNVTAAKCTGVMQIFDKIRR